MEYKFNDYYSEGRKLTHDEKLFVEIGAVGIEAKKTFSSKPYFLNNDKPIKNIKKRGKETMKNKLTDLNNHLFAELERLGNEELSAEELTSEIERAKAIAGMSNQIINNAHLQLNAIKLHCEYANANVKGLIEINE